MKLNSRLTVASRYGTLMIGGILGLAWFIYVFGPSRLDPTYLSWFMYGDGAQHVLGWLFFRNAPWSWPLGAVPDFPYPVGTTVGYTDSIPWLAVALKVLSPVLPADFHYAGLWLGWCFFLQGWFGVQIVQALSPHPFVQILGGACFAFDPLLLLRTMHPALDAHWLLLGLIWLHLQPWPVDRAPRRILALALAFCLISAGIHPYLAIMVLALSLAVLWKLHWVDRRLARSQIAVWAGIYSAAVLSVFTLFGYFGSGMTWERETIGIYSADLLTLVNPVISRFLPHFPWALGQYEGFGYVGSGILVGSVIGVLVICYNPGILRRCSLKPWVPLGICVALLALYALSPRVKLAGTHILTLEDIYHPFFKIAAIFHASGRFIWPLHYVWITAVVALFIAYYRTSRFTLYIILAAIITIQVIDLNVPFLGWGWQYPKGSPFIFEGGAGERAAGLYKHLVLYPPEIWGGSLPGCVTPPVTMDILDRYVPLAYQAYRSKMTFNSGYFARINQSKSVQYCQELHQKIQAGEFEPDTIYVVHSAYWHVVSPHRPKIVCGRLAEYITCVSALRHDAFRDVLEQHRFE